MDISSDKQAKSHKRRPGYGQERESLTEKLNLFRKQHKKRHKDYVKAKIKKTQQISGCRLCGEMINCIKSECSKLVQKE